MEHLKLSPQSIKGYHSENENQLFSIFHDENPKSSGLILLYLGIRLAKKNFLLKVNIEFFF